jgi:ABC-type glycerol-3-phosphate transport system substrate-binding protein
MKCKKMLGKIFIILLLVLSLCLTVACGNDGQEYLGSNSSSKEEVSKVNSDKVVIYTYVNPDDDDQSYTNDSKYYYPLIEMARMYNNYCTGTDQSENSISIVKFSSRDRMIQQMSTEIMAGGGPDIIILDNELPISKLINQGAFCDLNDFISSDKSDNALDLNDYNEDLLNTGVFKGKRYMMPMLIEPDIYITSTSALKNSGIAEGDKITYDNMEKTLKDFAESSDNVSFLDGYESSLELLYSYITDNIDVENATASFDTKSFKSNIEFIKKLITKSMKSNTANSVSDGSCVLSKGSYDNGIYTPYIYDLSTMRGRSTSDFVSDYAQWYNRVETYNEPELLEEIEGMMQEEKEEYESSKKDVDTPVFIDSFTENADTVKATVVCGFMINANSDKKDKAYNFIKYSMGERMQRYITYDGTSYNLPVNNQSLKNSYEDMGYSSSEFNKLSSNSSYMEKYLNHISKINTYVVNDGYYKKNVIGSITEDYLQDKISTDSFIRNLTSKTKIYLNE